MFFFTIHDWKLRKKEGAGDDELCISLYFWFEIKISSNGVSMYLPMLSDEPKFHATKIALSVSIAVSNELKNE